MTLPTDNIRMDYDGNDVTVTFPYTFKIFAASDLLVILTDETTGVETTQTITTHYSVTGAGSANGGNVVFVTAPTSNQTVAIIAQGTFTQTTDLVNETSFFQDRTEDRFDRLCRDDQVLNEKQSRSLKLPLSEDGSDTMTILPPLEERKGNALGFDPTTGAPAVYAPLGGATVSAAMIPVVQAATVQGGMNLIAGAVTANTVLRGNGSNVVLGKLELADQASMTDARLLGRSAGSAGIPQELTVGDGLSLSGGSLTASLAFFGRIFNSTPVAHTAAGTLTVDRMNTVSLTSADATLSFPAASGNTGKVVGVKVMPTNTKRVTLDGNASETLDGATTLTVSAGSSSLWYCDGSNWNALVFEPVGRGFVVFARTDAGQAITVDSEKISFEDIAINNGGIWDGETLIPLVTGTYAISIHAKCTSSASRSFDLYDGGARVATIGHSAGGASMHGDVMINLDAGASYSFRLGVAGGTFDTYVDENILSITYLGRGS